VRYKSNIFQNDSKGTTLHGTQKLVSSLRDKKGTKLTEKKRVVVIR